MAEDVSSVAWYHTIELGDGTVTPGRFDTRAAARALPFPESLAGRRCLDVGTADGFWAFEMERRGASDVVAIDVDDPSRRDWPWHVKPPKPETGMTGRGGAFSIAHRALGSKVERVDIPVYDLSPERVGRFDFAFIGSLLLHLRDPVRALASVAGVLDGELLVGETISLYLSLLHPIRPVGRLDHRRRSQWWTPNVKALHRWVVAGGYRIVATGSRYSVKAGPGFPPLRDAFRSRRTGVIASSVRLRLTGIPHAWVRAVPLAAPKNNETEANQADTE